MSKRNNFSAPKIWFVGHDDRFRFADARWAEQQKTSARTARLGQAEFAALHHRDDARQDVGLPANFERQQRRSSWRRRSSLFRFNDCLIHASSLPETFFHFV